MGGGGGSRKHQAVRMRIGLRTSCHGPLTFAPQLHASTGRVHTERVYVYEGRHAHSLSPGAYDPVNSSAGVSVSVSVNNLQVSSTTWRCRSCLPPTGLYASTALHMQTNWLRLHEPGLLKRWHMWLQSLAVAMSSTSTSLAGPKGATGTACTTRNLLKKRWRNRGS